MGYGMLRLSLTVGDWKVLNAQMGPCSAATVMNNLDTAARSIGGWELGSSCWVFMTFVGVARLEE